MMKKYSGSITALFLIITAGPAFTQVTETFSSSGTWTCPAGVTSVVVECWGGGGGGGRTSNTGVSRPSAGGGAGGAYARDTINVVPGTAYNFTVGPGGPGGSDTASATANGQNGGDSWFIDNVTILAKGGAAGSTNSSTAGGPGGTGSSAGSIGAVLFAGGNGAAGVTGTSGRSGGGGGSAGSMGPGGHASTTSTAGGAAGMGGGADGADGSTNTISDGANGATPGGGGSGGRTYSPTANGGNGGNGQVKLTYTPPPPANDEASGAVALTVNSDNNCMATTAGTTFGATATANVAAGCMATGDDDDVWYSFAATQTTHRITWTGNSSAMAVALYSGAPGSLLMPVPSGCAVNNALTVTGLTPGATYYIRAYTTGMGPDVFSDFNICAGVPEAAPANDDCTTAIAIGSSFPYSNSQAMPGSATQVSFQNTCTLVMNDGVWYTFTGTGAPLRITATPTGSGWNTALGVYSGSCGSLTCVAMNNNTFGTGAETYTLASTAGTVYYINIGYASGTANEEEKGFSLLIEDVTPPVNDDATGAIMLTLGAGCPAEPFRNNYATVSTGEVFPSCRVVSSSSSNTFVGWPVKRPVWFKFIAPASGAVRISTDNGGTIVGTGTRTAVCTATDPGDYSTFSIIHCAGNSGVNAPYANILYPAGLVPGATYYIVMDVYGSFTEGTFCITVDELDGSMIATTTGDCIDGDDMGPQAWTGLNADYKEWISLVDAEGRLNANIRQISGNARTFSTSRTIKTGIPRADNANSNRAYMNRNLLINNVGDPATNADIQFFFTDAELLELGVSPTALNVTRVTGTTCSANFMDGSGATSLLTQTAHKAMDGVHMIQVNTPGFSNFYIHTSNMPLPLELISFTGRYRDGSNLLEWETAAEINLSRFELQRSADGRQFGSIGNVRAKGEKNNAYRFDDNNILNGKSIYRLKMVDADGSFSYSNTIEVNSDLKDGFAFTAGPNPVQGSLHVSIKGTLRQAGSLQVTDLYGKTVYRIIPENDHITIDMSMLPVGSYYVRYTDADHTRTIKVVKH